MSENEYERILSAIYRGLEKALDYEFTRQKTLAQIEKELEPIRFQWVPKQEERSA